VPRVEFYAALRQAAGGRETDVRANPVKELLEIISRDYGGKLDRYLKKSTVLVNGKNVAHLKGKKTRLRPDDVVSI
jgi:molybdopterin converting factor small subunit